jgi:PleD family two-component response regulator
MEIAEKIQLSIASNATTSLPTTYTISIGITSIIPYPSLELDTLYTKCDHALYEAKRNGKNKIFRSENE